MYIMWKVFGEVKWHFGVGPQEDQGVDTLDILPDRYAQRGICSRITVSFVERNVVYSWSVSADVAVNESYGLLSGIEVNYSYIHTLLGTMFFLLSSHPSKSLTPSGLEQMSCYSSTLAPALPTRTLALSLSHLATFQSRRYLLMKQNRSFLITILCSFMCLPSSQVSLLRISSPELAVLMQQMFH